jgi:hypothetical protein
MENLRKFPGKNDLFFTELQQTIIYVHDVEHTHPPTLPHDPLTHPLRKNCFSAKESHVTTTYNDNMYFQHTRDNEAEEKMKGETYSME